MAQPKLTVSGIVLDSPDARELAAFYERLLGWRRRDDEPEWVVLANPDGEIALSFQTENAYIRPSWPADSQHQQMMMHLDIRVDDLDEAGAHAVSVGAVLADFQPQERSGCTSTRPDTPSVCGRRSEAQPSPGKSRTTPAPT